MSLSQPSLPLISIVVPAYNRARFLPGLLDSIRSQTYSNFEIIIVDDGSTDGTDTILRQLGDEVRWCGQKNSGLSAARNTGIGMSRGELIAFMDSDDLWDEQKLELQVAYLSRHPQAGLVYTASAWESLNEGTTGRNYCGDRVDVHDLLALNTFSPSSVLVRRTVLESIGLFDESIRFGEDIDMWIRIGVKYQLHGMDRDLVLAQFHEENMSHNVRNKLKHLPSAILKHQDAHTGCQLCLEISRATVKSIKREGYNQLKRQATLAIAEKKYLDAAAKTAFALVVCPEAPFRFVVKAMRHFRMSYDSKRK